MKKYDIKFDLERFSFVCEKTVDDQKVFLQVIPILKHLDDINIFDRIVIKDDYIKLINTKNKTILKINDIKTFIRKGYLNYLPNNLKNIKKKMVKNESLKPLIKSPIDKKIPVTAGLIALMLLAGGTSISYAKKLEDEPKAIELVSQPIPEDNILTLNTNEEISVEPIELTNTTTVEENEINEENQVINLNYQITNNIDKQQYAQEQYGDIVNQYAQKWGVDPRLIVAILTQESAGREKNLMQIEFKAWEGTLIHAYNFIDQKYENFLLSDNPNLYSNSERTIITSADLENSITNISIGTCLFYMASQECNNNLVNALLLYNQGHGNMNKIYREAEENSGYTKEDFLNDPNNLEFLNYTYASGQGDPLYPYNVMQYIINPDEPLSIHYLDEYENDYVINYYVSFQENNLTNNK